MAVNKTKALGTGIGFVNAPVNWNFLYETSTVKPAGWNVGDRVQLPSGEVFYLAKAGNALNNPLSLVYNANIIPGIIATHGYEGNLYEAVTVPSPNVAFIGGASKLNVIKIADTATRVEDYYAGGMITQFFGADARIFQTRIVSSKASNGTYVELTLDADYVNSALTSYGIDAYPSIYNNVKSCFGMGSNDFVTWVGVPMVKVANGAYCWLQTWGRTWITPNVFPGLAANLRDVVAHTDGTIRPAAAADTGQQRIGTMLYAGDGSAYGDAVCMLQISP